MNTSFFTAAGLGLELTILVNIKLRPIFTEYSASVEHPRRKEVSVNLVKKLCDGLAMTMGEFFPQRCLMIWSRRYSRNYNKQAL